MVVHDVQVYKVICDGMKQEGVSLWKHVIPAIRAFPLP